MRVVKWLHGKKVAFVVQCTLIWRGEIGLDYHDFPGYNYAKPNTQIKFFKKQIELALRRKLPIIIHTREAEEDTFSIMQNLIPKDWKLHVEFPFSIPFPMQIVVRFIALLIQLHLLRN